MFRSYLSRLAAVVTAVTVGLLASAVAMPAAFAQEIPQATGHAAAATGGLAGWQIALIGVGVPVAATAITILLRRARAVRSAA